jgi:putative methionine-R-sulfoxide reductase with GAF domain
MAASIEIPRLASNRRGRVRQKVNVPAYATFTATSQSGMLDLYEILNISETGIALQCSQSVQVNETVELALDLAESKEQISTEARVVWSDSAGRVGLSLPSLKESYSRQLREWLFLNVLATAANSDSPLIQHNYTDILSAVSAVQKEAEALGADMEAVLALIASRSRSLLRASGAAIALEEMGVGEQQTLEMVCRASSGTSAPPVGIILQVGSGFSGECVRTGKLSRCDDTEIDERVDRQSCRALGIRSMLAAPLRVADRIIGLLEVFSPEPCAFREHDGTVLQRFGETIVAVVTRAGRVAKTTESAAQPKPFIPPAGGVLFANLPEEREKQQPREPNSGKEDTDQDQDKDKVGGIRLPRFHLFLLIAVAATVCMVLGFLTAPWIQPWVQARFHGGVEQTVLASSKSPTEKSPAENAVVQKAAPNDFATLAQTREAAERGDAAAENALGLLYAAGDEKQGIKRDDAAAVRWFTKAAEHGSVPAQSKLGALYWGGRGVAQDSNRAYFWTVLARASGDNTSKVLAPFIAARLTPPERAAIEQQANQWVQEHDATTKAAR